MVLMRVTDIFISFRVWSALAFVAALGPGLEHVVIAITLTARRRLPVWRAPKRSLCAS